MNYFEKDFLDIYWDANVKCVVMQWKKFVKGQDFREGLNAGLSLLIEKKASKWMADMRHMQVLGLDDQEWSNKDWFPRAIKGGIRKMALIMPASSLAKMGVKNIMNKVGTVELETSYFDDSDQARNWLKS